LYKADRQKCSGFPVVFGFCMGGAGVGLAQGFCGSRLPTKKAKLKKSTLLGLFFKKAFDIVRPHDHKYYATQCKRINSLRP
jgi:hypothetical protein